MIYIQSNQKVMTEYFGSLNQIDHLHMQDARY
jgi:hypothetical protein